jgi:hypothetical protein
MINEAPKKEVGQKYVILKETTSGNLLQTLLVAKLLSETETHVEIKEALRFCEAVGVRPVYDRITGKPTDGHTYIIEKFQFPDTILTTAKSTLLEKSKFIYCLVVDDNNPQVDIYEKSLVEIRAVNAGLVPPSGKLSPLRELNNN